MHLKSQEALLPVMIIMVVLWYVRLLQLPVQILKKTGSGKAAIYKDNGDDTVTDLRNGWVWQKAGNITAETHLTSNQYCTDLELANLSDWRMPDEDELKIIVDYGRSQNIINPAFSCQEGNYWTATPHKKDADEYQTIGFFVADSNAYPSDATHFVRCIHRAK